MKHQQCFFLNNNIYGHNKHVFTATGMIIFYKKILKKFISLKKIQLNKSTDMAFSHVVTFQMWPRDIQYFPG